MDAPQSPASTMTDADIWAVVLTGAGSLAISAGADLKDGSAGQGHELWSERGDHALGLVNHLAPADGLIEAAPKLAGRITVNAPVAVRESLAVARHALDLDDAALRAMSGQAGLAVRRSEDFKEGPRAFVEKRAPRWTGM